MVPIDRTRELLLQTHLDDMRKEFSIFYRVLGLPNEPLYAKSGTVEFLESIGIELTEELIDKILDAAWIPHIALEIRRAKEIHYDDKDDDWYFFWFFEHYEKIVEGVPEQHRDYARRAIAFGNFVRNLPKYQQLKHELFDRWK